jgi:hypothetical protein
VVTVAICAVLGNLNKSVPALSNFPTFKIDLKIARDVSDNPLNVESMAISLLGSSSFRDVCCYDYIQQSDIEVFKCIVLHGGSIVDYRSQCGMLFSLSLSLWNRNLRCNEGFS